MAEKNGADTIEGMDYGGNWKYIKQEGKKKG